MTVFFFTKPWQNFNFSLVELTTYVLHIRKAGKMHFLKDAPIKLFFQKLRYLLCYRFWLIYYPMILRDKVLLSEAKDLENGWSD